jgi:hypothetical protein
MILQNTKTALFGTALCSALLGFSTPAGAVCADGDKYPADYETDELVDYLVVLRQDAGDATQELRDAGYSATARRMYRMSSETIRINGEVQHRDPTCERIGKLKGRLWKAMEKVWQKADEEGVAQADKDNVIAPVADSLEDLMAAGGVPRSAGE